MMENAKVGTKFYRYYNDRLEVVRLMKVKNSDKFVVKDEESGVRLSLTKAELEGYTLLNPDAHISICIVEHESVKDVIVAVHRTKDVLAGVSIPYAICRQNVMDTFSNQTNRNEKLKFVGMTMSVDTCPEDKKNLLGMLGCKSIIKQQFVSVYLDDSLDNIISLINTVNYDSILSELYDLFEMIDTSGEEEGVKYVGLHKTLKELLDRTKFIEEFRRGFNTMCIDFELSNEGSLLIEEKTKLEDVLKCEILEHTLIRYNKDINMIDAKYKHQLFATPSDKIFVLIYDPGEYINRTYDSFDDQSEKELLSNNI